MLLYAIFTVPALILSCVALLAVLRLSDILQALVKHLSVINKEIGDINVTLRDMDKKLTR